MINFMEELIDADDAHGNEDNNKVDRYVHLHVHTIYSLLDGACHINQLVKKTKELGMDSIAITDHNHLGGTLEFQKACKVNDIKPILGVEMYYTDDTSIASLNAEERHRIAYRAYYDTLNSDDIEDMPKPDEITAKELTALKKEYAKYEYDMTQFHILFLAINQAGWHNLIKLQSEASSKCTFNGRFLCDFNMIEKYNEGIICTTACVGSKFSKLIHRKEESKSESLIERFKNLFGDRFYLEIQPLQLRQQYETNMFYMRMAKKHNIKAVATNDVHYLLESDWDDHDTLICVSTGKYKKDKDRMRYSNDFWLRSKEEMIHAFDVQNDSMGIEHDIEEYRNFFIESMNNTALLSDRVEDDIFIGSRTPLIPKVKIGDTSPEDALTIQAYKKLFDYYKKHPEINITKYQQALDYELNIINQKGFADYMLVVQEFIEWAGKNNIAIGPGRGSAGGSETLYQIGVTKNIDPIKHNLIFERFLTPDRTALPDIDIDISYSGRSRGITHLEDYYGKSKVAHIGSWSVFGVASGIKDFGRVLGEDFGEMNKINQVLKTIPIDSPKPRFKDYDALKENKPELYAKFAELEASKKEVFRLARKFEGTCRQFGVHASGILVMPVDIVDMVPTRINTDDGTVITLYTGVEIDELNLVKLDILGLKTLTVIEKSLTFIGNKSLEWLYENADVNDDKVYDMIRSKKTDGMFQIESDMFKGIVGRIQPDCLDDITAIGALGRPGPISIGQDRLYADRKNGKANIVYPIHGCEDIFKDTYGTAVYQEQLMAVSKRIAGFDNGQADSLTRKVFAKKKADMMEMLRRCHFYGKINKQGYEGWENDSEAPWYDWDKLHNAPHYGGEIKGALANGYTIEELNKYWNSIIGFASYAFNKSHSACYGYITFLTAWLKTYYPTEFLAALLSMQDEEEQKERYVQVAEDMGIKVLCPDINSSKEGFTPAGSSILYGLCAVKGVKAAANVIIENAPYQSLEDAFNKIPRKYFNKTVATNLIKSGAFDYEDTNRNRLINKLYDLRKDKKIERLDESANIEKTNQAYEKEVLGTYVSSKPESYEYKAKWDKLKDKSFITERMEVISKRVHKDKKGNTMLFVKLSWHGYEIEGTIFASVLKKIGKSVFDELPMSFMLSGKKDNNKFLIDKATKIDNVSPMQSEEREEVSIEQILGIA